MQKIVSGEFKKNRVLISRLDLTSGDLSLPFTIKKKNIPVRLVYAMFIKKTQEKLTTKLAISY